MYLEVNNLLPLLFGISVCYVVITPFVTVGQDILDKVFTLHEANIKGFLRNCDRKREMGCHAQRI
jgi:hypothetical protein